jgi:hypothetical protein
MDPFNNLIKYKPRIKTNQKTLEKRKTYLSPKSTFLNNIFPEILRCINLFSYLMNNSFYTVDEFLEHTVNN